MMPRKDTLEFHHLYFLAIQRADGFGPPMLGECREFFLETHLFHESQNSTIQTAVFVLQSFDALR